MKLKERKTPLQSKRKVVAMMNLFEKFVDEPIVLMNVETHMIQTNNSLYRIDFSHNKVIKVNYEKYILNVNEPFE